MDEALPPLISVIVPSYNQGSFLPQTLDSILDQSYPRLELIVIDGGSDDASVEILQTYTQKLTYWCSEPDRGHGHALLKGFKRATGDIMCWLNSDDMFFPWTLQAVSKLFVLFPQVDWLTGRGVLRNEEGLPIREDHDRKNYFSFLIGDFGWIQQESTFWRRQLWDAAKQEISHSFEQPLSMVDTAVWCSFFKYADLYNSDLLLGSYRQHLANRAELHPAQCVLETQNLIAQILSPQHADKRIQVLIYRLLRQILSVYPVRMLANTISIQKALVYLLCPPPFLVIKYSRASSAWTIDKEYFLFKPHRPHSMSQLIGYAITLWRKSYHLMVSHKFNALR